MYSRPQVRTTPRNPSHARREQRQQREASASRVRFHTWTTTRSSRPPQPHARDPLHLRLSRQILPSSRLNPRCLSRLHPNELQRALDPLDITITRAVLESWEEAKLSELAVLITPEGVTAIINKVAGGAHHNTLIYRDLSYRLPAQHGQPESYVLRPVSGVVRSGELVGLVGASDAGATSLLRILAGRVELNQESSPSNRLRHFLQRTTAGNAVGEILFNGKPRQTSFRQDVGYLVKEDPNLSLLTVWETLLFSASLRQLPLFSPKLHRFIVSLVLKLLGLSHIKDSIVGDVLTRGISGGERRRVSYGCELVAGHHMILADLPTNGLDSHSAANLFRAVKFASLTGRAMMASIVQPTQKLFEMFDRIVLLCKGSMIFQGPPSEAEAHFNAAGFLRPQGKTVSAWLEEMSATPEKFWHSHKQAATARALQASPASVEDDLAWASEARQNAWKTLDQAYVNSKFNKEVMEIIKQSLASQEQEQTQYTITAPPTAASSLSSASALAPVAPFALASLEFPLGTGQYRISFPQQLRLVLQRQVLLLKRNRGMWIGFWVQSIVLGLILGSLFWQLGTEQKEVRVRFGLFWFIMMSQSFGVAQMIPTLCEQRVTYYNQINNSYYHPAAYYLGTVLPQLPVGLIQVMILVTILYPMSGLINGIGSGEYWFMCLLLLLVNWTARSFVMFICSISPSELVAQMLIPIFTLLFSSMCGFMNPKDAIPAGWRWLNTASYFTYTIRALSLNENKNLDWSCPTGQPCPYPTSDAVLNLYSMNNDFSERWVYFENLVWFFLSFNFGALICYWVVDWSAVEPAELPGFQVYAEEIPETDGQPQGKLKDIESGKVVAGGVAANVASTQLPLQTPSGAVLSAAASPVVLSPVCLEWKALSYSVPVPPPKGVLRHAAPTSRTLLKDVTGFARPGTLIALMGASGAGKTTLLDLLAAKKTGGTMTGHVLLNGAPVERDSFSRIAGYVEQLDSHDERATIRESLEFSARLRLPRATSEVELQRGIQHVMNVLNLTHLQNERIGTVEGGGITAVRRHATSEQSIRKKVTIAVELVANPRVLFLDEPTTGLDSTGAYSVMSIVRDLSRHISVICTIHQPSQEILNLFDVLYLLEAGQLVYFGPLTQVVPYIESQGWAAAKYAPDQNTADFAITGVKKGQSITDASTGAKFDTARAFQQSPQYAWAQQSLDDMNREFGLRSGAMPAAVAGMAASCELEYPHHIHQFLALLHRFLRTQVRDTMSSRSRIVMSLFFSFVVSTLFANLSLGQQAGANRIALLFMVIMFPIITSVLKLPQYIATRAVYFREKGSHMYSALPYSLARWVAEFPLILLEMALLSVIVYFSTGLTREDAGIHFAVFLGTLLTVRLMTFSYVEVMAGLVANPATATAITMLPLVICMLFAGFLIPKNSIPQGWIWMHYLSIIRYPLELLAVNELRFIDFTCVETSMMVAPPSYSTCPLLASARKCPLQCGAELLDQFGMDDSSDGMILNSFVIAIFMVGFRVLGYLALRFVNHVKR